MRRRRNFRNGRRSWDLTDLMTLRDLVSRNTPWALIATCVGHSEGSCKIAAANRGWRRSDTSGRVMPARPPRSCGAPIAPAETTDFLRDEADDRYVAACLALGGFVMCDGSLTRQEAIDRYIAVCGAAGVTPTRALLCQPLRVAA